MRSLISCYEIQHFVVTETPFCRHRDAVSWWLRRRFTKMPPQIVVLRLNLRTTVRQQREGNASNKRLRASLLRLFRAENFHAIWGIEAAYPSITQGVAILKFVNLFFSLYLWRSKWGFKVENLKLLMRAIFRFNSSNFFY